MKTLTLIEMLNIQRNKIIKEVKKEYKEDSRLFYFDSNSLIEEIKIKLSIIKHNH